jgi:acyl-CoA thioesterase FadM
MNYFTYEHLILFNETNALGGVAYFSNYVKWQGMAREYILCSHPQFKKLLSSGIEIVTNRCSVEFRDSLYFGDIVLIKIFIKQIMPASLTLLFEYLNKKTGQIVAIGEQKIAFINSESKQLCRMPKEILDLAESVNANNN